MFERVTYRNMTLPLNEGKYDYIRITADVLQHYSMADVYGGSDFIKGGNVKIEK